MIIHELYEQWEKQINKRAAFQEVHKEALRFEESMTGWYRTSETPPTPDVELKYTKTVEIKRIDKNGKSTVTKEKQEKTVKWYMQPFSGLGGPGALQKVEVLP